MALLWDRKGYIDPNGQCKCITIHCQEFELFKIIRRGIMMQAHNTNIEGQIDEDRLGHERRGTHDGTFATRWII